MNAVYRDKHGEVVTTVNNDGKSLSVVLRGVEFRGSDFDSLEPLDGTDPARVTAFTLSNGWLCACTIEAGMPLPVVMNRETLCGMLSIHIELGEPTPKGSIDREIVKLELTLGQMVYPSRGFSGCFEGELLDVQRQLPEGTYLKACFTCAFSDYSPYGQGMFGGLACFRDNKNGYMSVKGKKDLFRIWDTRTEFVQETYLCSQFQRRAPGAGYRG